MRVLREAIFHQCGGAYAYPVAQDCLLVQLRTAKNDIKEVQVVYGDRYRGADAVELATMYKYASDQLFDYYRVVLKIATRKFRYMFLIDDGRERLWYNEFGFHSHRPMGYHSGYFHFPYIADADLFEVPDWMRDAVVYEIFPERFYNGDLSNDPESVKIWGEKPTGEMDFFGGDLQGVIAKLPYLEKLGIDCIYFTPIFAAITNHKYATSDYYQIDPQFGDAETFRRLVEEAHQRGIRIVLDAVFNHCGYYFAPFQDVVEKGADSPYRDWFYIHDFPVSTNPLNYETFAGTVWRMPKLRTSHPEVQAYLLGVAEYWIQEFGIDGWRLDVANEIDHAFWREFRKRVKAIKPDACIVGEVWHHSFEFLMGDQYDAVMNYHFRDAVIRFFGERSIGVDEFDAWLTLNRVTYRKQSVDVAWNLLGSHDTGRILNHLKHSKQALRLAYAFQMTYPGVPFIYAGDEIGMEGQDDPDNRRCMIWDEEAQDQNLLDTVSRLIQIRRQHTPLRRGEVRTVLKDEVLGVYAYERYTDEEKILVIIHNGLKAATLEFLWDTSCSTATGRSVRELFQDQALPLTERGTVQITVEPGQIALIGS